MNRPDDGIDPAEKHDRDRRGEVEIIVEALLSKVAFMIGQVMADVVESILCDQWSCSQDDVLKGKDCQRLVAEIAKTDSHGAEQLRSLIEDVFGLTRSRAASSLPSYPNSGSSSVTEGGDLSASPGQSEDRGSEPGRGFFSDHDLERLASEQRVQPIAILADLRGDFWPDDEGPDEFLEVLRRLRRQSSDPAGS